MRNEPAIRKLIKLRDNARKEGIVISRRNLGYAVKSARVMRNIARPWYGNNALTRNLDN